MKKLDVDAGNEGWLQEKKSDSDKQSSAASRVAARPRKKIPTPPAAPPKRTLEKVVGESLSPVLYRALREADVIRSLKEFSVSKGSSGHFSDGVWPSDETDDLGYAFTIHYPTQVTAEGVFEVKLPVGEALTKALEQEAYGEDEDILRGTSPEAVQQVISEVLPQKLLETLYDLEIVPSKAHDLPTALQEAIEQEADSALEQSISAYSNEDPNVSLAEYPSVYLRWDIQEPQVTFGKLQPSGSEYRVPIKVVWPIKPNGWAFARDVGRNRWNHLHLGSISQRIAARYKKKKIVDSEKGGKTTVYMYSERQIARRNAEKAKRLEKLSKRIGELRKKVKRDLKSSDPEKCLTALAVALIDHTYERVGNEDSVKERKHYGVTGWRRSHVSFGRGTATIKYTGKSGVQQTKKVTDKAILLALKNAYEAAEDDESNIFEHPTGRVTATKVNAYLEPFDVTAKDIRGFHANSEMQQRLKAVRAKAGALPEDKKERKAKLKEEFKKALEETAEAVGHEASTLRSQYLVPGIEESYLKDGTVQSTFTKTAAYPFVPDADEMGDTEPSLDTGEIAARVAQRFQETLPSGKT